MAAEKKVTRCACRIAGPLGIGAVLAEGYVTRIVDGVVYGVNYCPLHAAAAEMLAACKAMLKAADELMTEFVSKKRAADWGVINEAMMAAAAAIAKAKAA